MRDVVLYTLLSLDGVAEEPGDWMFEADEDVFTNLAEVIRSQDDILLGRGTYDYWADYWPTSDVQPFADFVNGTAKHVFTSSAPSVLWPQTTIVDEGVVPYVARLKEGQGGDVGVHGRAVRGQGSHAPRAAGRGRVCPSVLSRRAWSV